MPGMGETGERDRELETAERVVRVETEVVGLRNDFTDFRKEMRNMWGAMIQTYPTREELRADLKLRDQRIEALEKAQEVREQTTTVTTNTSKTARASIFGAVIGGLIVLIPYIAEHWKP